MMDHNLLSYTLAAMSLALCAGALDVDMNIVNAQIAPDGFPRS
jgi:hypothetical protein